MRWVMLLLGCVGLSQTAHATDLLALDTKLCVADDAMAVDQRVAACTRMIARSYSTPRINRAEALFRRSYAFDAKHEYDAAISDLTAALRLAPNNPAYLNNRAYTWKLKGDIDHRLADYAALYAVSPTFNSVTSDLSDALVDRGNRSERSGQYDAAIADYDTALVSAPKNYGALNNRGMALMDKRDYKPAIEALDEAIAAEPGRFEAYETLGQAWTAVGDLDQALDNFSKAIVINPGKAQTFQRRAEIYRRKGDLPSALADAERAASLDPGLSDAVQARDQIRAALSKTTPPVAAAAAAGPDATLIPASRVPGPAIVPEGTPPVAALGKRVALVIGNGAYESVARLANPTRDADLVANALRRAGFASVTLSDDVTRVEFEDALRRFAEEAVGADWAVVYFAGHGLEMNGTNYLIPVDAKLATDRAVQFEAVPLDQVLAAVDGAKALKLVMLDACRNNPFEVTMQRSLGTRSVGRGLARIEPDAGEIVAFAASPGQIAEDGDHGDSPFASALAAHVGDPDEEIYQFFRVVRDEVVRVTGAKQQPYVNASLSADKLYFTPRPSP